MPVHNFLCVPSDVGLGHVDASAGGPSRSWVRGAWRVPYIPLRVVWPQHEPILPGHLLQETFPQHTHLRRVQRSRQVRNDLQISFLALQPSFLLFILNNLRISIVQINYQIWMLYCRRQYASNSLMIYFTNLKIAYLQNFISSHSEMFILVRKYLNENFQIMYQNWIFLSNDYLYIYIPKI